MSSSTDVSELNDQASALIDADQTAAALPLYREAIVLNPNNAEAWLMQGAILGETWDLVTAERSIDKTLIIDSKYIEAYLTLARLQQALGR